MANKFRHSYIKQIEKVYITPSRPQLYKWITSVVMLQWFCLFLFLFIFVESLKNHSKSQKNHKMKNLILLDFTLVDLHSEHIIWYALGQNFCYNFRSMNYSN